MIEFIFTILGLLTGFVLLLLTWPIIVIMELRETFYPNAHDFLIWLGAIGVNIIYLIGIWRVL